MGQPSSLLKGYKNSLSILRQIQNKHIKRIKEAKFLSDSERESLFAEKRIINSMYRDTVYVIKWLECGHEPDHWNGVPNIKVGERN